MTFSSLPPPITDLGFHVRVVWDLRSFGKKREEMEGYLVFQERLKEPMSRMHDPRMEGITITQASVDAVIPLMKGLMTEAGTEGVVQDPQMPSDVPASGSDTRELQEERIDDVPGVGTEGVLQDSQIPSDVPASGTDTRELQEERIDDVPGVGTGGPLPTGSAHEPEGPRQEDMRGSHQTYLLAVMVGGIAVCAAGALLLLRRRSRG